MADTGALTEIRCENNVDRVSVHYGVGGAAQLLRLLAYLIYRQVLGSHVVQADDTKLPVQDRRKAKNIKRGRLWALVGDHFYVEYRYASDWRATTTFEILGERIGWLQVDAYKGYVPIFAIGKAIEVGCNMHCRRYFVRALGRGCVGVEHLIRSPARAL